MGLKNPRARFLGLIAAVLAVPAAAILLFLAVVLSGMLKDKRTWKEPTVVRMDASRLDPVKVGRVLRLSPDSLEALAQLREALHLARAESLKISISGARHSMGNQTAWPGALVIDMLGHDRLRLDSAEGRVFLRVQAGARWSDVVPYLDHFGYAVRVMQSNNPFSVGGTLSVNAHGWQHNRPPFASTVEAFTLFTADGRLRRCSRDENAELFRLAAGGYGLFGVILEVELNLVRNEVYRSETRRFPARDYAAVFAEWVDAEPRVGMAYGRLSVAPGSFLRKAVLTRYVLVPDRAPDSLGPPVTSGFTGRLKRAVFLAGVGSPLGKQARWLLESLAGGESTGEFSRNALMQRPLDLFENFDSTRTQILHEYFVPRDSLEAFLARARRIIPEREGDLLNVTVRNLEPDTDTRLAYARVPVFSLVMLFSYARTPDADSAQAALTRALVDAALDCGGTYYLPYRRHATSAQFRRAYPDAVAFFASKRHHDPEELFTNSFYESYGREVSPD